MLHLICALYASLKTVGYYSILLSYKTGQAIVTGLLTSLELLATLCDTLWTAAVIVKEDFLVFLSDAASRLGAVIGTLVNAVELTVGTIATCLTLVRNTALLISDYVILTFQTVLGMLARIIGSVTSLLAAVKHLCILFGAGVWFVVTLLPVSVVHACVMFTYYAGRFCHEIKTAVECGFTQTATILHDLYDFVTDVPAESTAGLLLGICFAYALFKFHVMLYRSARRLFRDLVTDRLRSRRPQVEQLQQQTTSSKVITQDQDGGTCVICMERSKCMLAMPCRHLCMCRECCEALRVYQRTCPICRRYVTSTIHVY